MVSSYNTPNITLLLTLRKKTSGVFAPLSSPACHYLCLMGALYNVQYIHFTIDFYLFIYLFGWNHLIFVRLESTHKTKHRSKRSEICPQNSILNNSAKHRIPLLSNVKVFSQTVSNIKGYSAGLENKNMLLRRSNLIVWVCHWGTSKEQSNQSLTSRFSITWIPANDVLLPFMNI